MGVREEVLSAFREDYSYSHILPFEYQQYIDGMGHLACLAGLAKRAGDEEVAEACRLWLVTLVRMHPDARNFAPQRVNDSWEPARIPGYWVKRKPQSFWGPAMWYYAMEEGVRLDPELVEDVMGSACFFVTVAPLFGLMIRVWPFKGFRQHINTVVMSHLLMRSRPSSTLAFLIQGNPLYAAIFGLPVVGMYPNTGPWPAKDYPGSDPEISPQKYTPTCSLAGVYAQKILLRDGKLF